MIGVGLDRDWLRYLEQHIPSECLMQVARVLGKQIQITSDEDKCSEFYLSGNFFKIGT